jgi:hypothetical protein
MGASKKPAITYSGNGIRKMIGMKPKKARITIEITETGTVSKAMKSIKETYVSG